MNVLRRALAVAFTAVLGGCVLLIDKIDTQDHCGIQGSGLCADCIKNSCQELIDKCCGQNECTGSSILGDLDTCARNRNAECADALSLAKPAADQEAIRACVATSCKDPCTSGSTGTGNASAAKWTCTTSRGTTNECSTCIYGKCKASIDDCCGDSSCKNDDSIQKDMGACVGGDERGCAYMLDESKRSTAGKAGVVRKCIQDSCVKECLGDGLPHTTCTLLSGGEYCSCSNAEKSGTQECTKALVGGDCWIGKEGCVCGTYSCDPYITDRCKCSLGAGRGSMGQSCRIEPSGSSSSGSSLPELCCLKLDSTSISCECLGRSECKAEYDEYNTASCDRADVLEALAGVGRVVQACSR